MRWRGLHKPSQIEMYNPFKFVSSTKDEHFQFCSEAEDDDEVKKYVELCNKIQDEARAMMYKQRFRITSKLESLPLEDFQERLRALVPPRPEGEEDKQQQ